MRGQVAGWVIENHRKYLGHYSNTFNYMVAADARDLYLRVLTERNYSRVYPEALPLKEPFLFFGREPILGHTVEAVLLRDFMSMICEGGTYLSQMEIYYPSSSLIIANNRILYDLYDPSRIEMMDYQMDWYGRIVASDNKNRFFSDSDGGNLIMIRLLTKGNAVIGVLFLYYSIASLENLMWEAFPAEIDSLAVLNGDGTFLFNLGAKDAFAIPPGAAERGYFETGAGDGMSIRSVKHDAENDWYYVVSSRINPYMDASGYILRNVAISGVISLAIGLILVFILSAANARPFAALVRVLSNVRPPENERNVYRYLTGTFVDIVGELDLIKHENKKITQYLQNNAAYRILSKSPLHLLPRGDSGVSEETFFPYRFFAAAAFASRVLSGDENGYDMAKLFFTLEQAFNPPDLPVTAGVGENGAVLLAVVNFDEPEDYASLCERISSGLPEALFYIAAGAPHDSMEDAARAAGDALSALEERYLFPERVRCEPGKTGPFTDAVIKTRELNKRFIQSVKKKDGAAAQVVLTDFTNELRSGFNAAGAVMQARDLEINLETIINDPVEWGALKNVFLECKDVLSLKDALSAWVRGYCGETNADGDVLKLVDNMKFAVEKNILNPNLSLVFVAQELGVSETYLSRLFRKHYRMTFLEFVSDKKLELARDALLQTNKAVKEISAELGYMAVPYFISLFKKKYGETPAVYRGSHR